MKPYVLITRPAADALEVAQEVEGRGYRPFIEPMLSIRPLSFTMPENYQALVFTSANAVRVAAEAMADRSRPVYCVGDHTAAVARACGWGQVRSAGGDAAALISMLEAEKFEAGSTLVHLSGIDVSRNIEVMNKAIERRIVYRAAKAQVLSDALVTILEEGTLAAALFFSVRTAEAFAELLEKHDCTQSVKTTKALCIADSVVESVRHLPWQDVQAAQRPNRQALVTLLDSI